ncbi:hypothetical protein F2P79_017764 [Pimephales promelas]|nr:hypothetical protein F2P79_017764 [Pimephales promelas]
MIDLTWTGGHLREQRGSSEGRDWLLALGGKRGRFVLLETIRITDTHALCNVINQRSFRDPAVTGATLTPAPHTHTLPHLEFTEAVCPAATLLPACVLRISHDDPETHSQTGLITLTQCDQQEMMSSLHDLENILLSHFIPPPSIKFLLLSHERSSLDATSVFHWAGVMTNTLSQLIKNTHRTDGDLSSVFSTARHHGSLSYLIKSGLKTKDFPRKAFFNKSTLNPLCACEALLVLVSTTRLDWRRCDRLCTSNQRFLGFSRVQTEPMVNGSDE